jgi:hypothetical protein
MLKFYAILEVQLQLNKKGAGSKGGRLSFIGADTASISLDYSGRQFNCTYITLCNNQTCSNQKISKSLSNEGFVLGFMTWVISIF